MNRRTLLALVASLPALTAAPATACSVRLKSPRYSGRENQQVLELFEAWYERDAAKFKELFTKKLMDDGSPMEAELARAVLQADPIPPQTFAIFGRFFTDTHKLNRLELIVSTDAGVIVACSEANVNPVIDGDCTGIPKLHLFLVTLNGLNPRSITHLATTESVEASKFSIWTAGSS